MNTFIEIPTPFPSLKTVKLEQSETFRPSATGVDPDQNRLKTLMEALEIKASVGQESGFIASAAHTNVIQVVENVRNEANERISVAAWWALRRDVLGKISNEDEVALRDQYEVGEDFIMHIGFVESFSQDGFVAVSILENRTAYPYIVLGAAFDAVYETAVQKSFIESVQSWTASTWEATQPSQKKELWDMAELKRRAVSIDGAPMIDTRTVLPSQHENLKRLLVQEYPDGYVGWIYADQPMTGRSAQLAQLAMRSGELVTVYTDHNQ